jgi:hypothetical protein
MNAPQQKEVSGSNAEAHIDGSLWLSIIALLGAAIAVVTSRMEPEKIELRFQLQQQRLETTNREQAKLIDDMRVTVRDMETEVMLLRQDVADLRVESRSKLEPRARPK